MCEPPPPVDWRLPRRRFLVAAPVGAAGALLFGGLRPVTAAADVSIVPRSEWGPTLHPTGPVPDEPDVRFLLVHHSVNANTYAQSAVPGLLKGIFDYHTGTKGWPDIAYNFFVDRFGGIWEGRSGSLAGAKAPDATGGSQGFAQLGCFLGDHSTEPPSDAARASMGALLGWMAERYGVDLADGARAHFTSRGSNRYPSGAAVDVATVSGHRDVSQTACPGDAAYALVADGTYRRPARGGAASAPATTAAPTTTARRSTTTTAAPTTTAPASSTSTSAGASSSSSAPLTSSTTAGSTTVPDSSVRLGRADGGGSSRSVVAGVGAAIAAAAAAGAIALRVRRRDP